MIRCQIKWWCWNSIQLSSNYIYGGGKKSVSINHRYQARLTSNPPLIHHHTVINLSFVRSDWNIQNPREQHFHSTRKNNRKKNDIFANKKREKWNKTQHSTFCRFFYYFLFFFSSTLLFCYSFALLPRQYIYLYSMKSHANGWDFSYRLNSSAFLHSESSST